MCFLLLLFFCFSLVGGTRDEDHLIQLGNGRYKYSGYRLSSPPGFGLPRLTGSVVLPYSLTFQLPFYIMVYYARPLEICNKLWLLF